MRYICLAAILLGWSGVAYSQIAIETASGRAYQKVDSETIGNRLDSLDSQVVSLMDSITAGTSEQSGFSSSLDSLLLDVTEVQDSLAALAADAAGLDERISDLETEVVTGSNAASAMGRVGSDGTVLSGFNLACTRTATGNYTVTFDTPLANATYAIFIQAIGTSNDTNAHINSGSIATTGFSFWLGDADNGGSTDVPVNRDFSVMVVSW